MYLHVTLAGPVWPYSRAQLLADNPNVSFRIDPSAEELEPFGVLIVTPTNPPEHDPALQQAVEVHPVERDGQWFQVWEMQDVPPLPPMPDWGRFKRICLADGNVNQVLAAAQTTAPAAALALPAALMSLAQGGDIADFRGAWLLVRNLDLVPQAVLDHLSALATDCHLPDEFVQLFEPPATPQFNADGSPYTD